MISDKSEVIHYTFHTKGGKLPLFCDIMLGSGDMTQNP